MDELDELYAALREMRVPESCVARWHAARVAIVNLKLGLDAADRAGEPAFLEMV